MIVVAKLPLSRMHHGAGDKVRSGHVASPQTDASFIGVGNGGGHDATCVALYDATSQLKT